MAQGNAAGAVEYVGDLADDRAIALLHRQAAVVVSAPPPPTARPQLVLEATAGGATPGAVSDLPALRPWVRHEQEGLVTPVGDAAALAGAIVRLLDDEALRAAVLQAAAVRRVQQRLIAACGWNATSRVTRQTGGRPAAAARRFLHSARSRSHVRQGKQLAGQSSLYTIGEALRAAACRFCCCPSTRGC